MRARFSPFNPDASLPHRLLYATLAAVILILLFIISVPILGVLLILAYYAFSAVALIGLLFLASTAVGHLGKTLHSNLALFRKVLSILGFVAATVFLFVLSLPIVSLLLRAAVYIASAAALVALVALVVYLLRNMSRPGHL